MRLVATHVVLQARELARYPAFIVPTLALPALFFLVFAAPRANQQDATTLMAFYAAFAILGVAFFQFGVGISAERNSPWERFLRTLPVSPLERFAARVVVALAFASIAATTVIGVAVATTPAAVPATRWPLLAGGLVLGGVPFALLGIAIGYWAQPRAALPLANVLYLLLAFAGGLWTGFAALPGPVRAISPYLPTRQWAELLTAASGATGMRVRDAAGLVLYTVLFAGLALFGYRRDEGQRFA